MTRRNATIVWYYSPSKKPVFVLVCQKNLMRVIKFERCCLTELSIYTKTYLHIECLDYKYLHGEDRNFFIWHHLHLLGKVS